MNAVQTVTVQMPEKGLRLVLDLVQRNLWARRVAREAVRPEWCTGSHKHCERANCEELTLREWYEAVGKAIGYETKEIGGD